MPTVRLEEQETAINIDYENGKAFVFTSNPVMKKKLASMLNDKPEDVELYLQTETDISVIVPKGWIKIRPPQKKPWAGSNLADKTRKEESA